MQTAKQILHGYLRLYRSISEEYRGQFGTVTLTFPQTLVLSLLSAEGPMPISELAKATGSANSTFSGVLDRLEQMESKMNGWLTPEERSWWIRCINKMETGLKEAEYD